MGFLEEIAGHIFGRFLFWFMVIMGILEWMDVQTAAPGL
jgi:hypothetical protein